MCLLGQVSDARLGRSQDRAFGLDLAAGCHCGSDLHVVLGICFLGSLHGPRHTLLTMSERHLMLSEVSVELRLSLSLLFIFYWPRQVTWPSHMSLGRSVCSTQTAASQHYGALRRGGLEISPWPCRLREWMLYFFLAHCSPRQEVLFS